MPGVEAAALAFHTYKNIHKMIILNLGATMQKINCIKPFFFVLFLACLHMADSLQAQEMRFYAGKWANILSRAKEENKLIFVDAYTTWCGPCKWMAENTFTDKKASLYYNRHFINTKVNMEKGEGPALAERYKVSAYPTLLYINGDGEVVHRVVGALDATRLLKEGEVACNPDSSFMSWQKKYESGNREPEFILVFIEKTIDAGLDSESIVAEYFRSLQKEQMTSPASWQIINTYVQDESSPVFEFLVKNRKVFADLYSQDSVNKKIINVYYTNIMRSCFDVNPAAHEAAKEKLRNSGFEQADKLLLMIEADSYKAKGEWERYAEATINYLSTYPSNDPKELNGHAWAFYEYVDDIEQLKTAKSWVEKALQLREDYSTLDTYAALLYKLNNKEEAKLYAEKAIAQAKATGEDYTETEDLLKKINDMK
jgi:thiol-disulfide isomerase/thioredoxin